jgi:hypothetical protein
MALISTKLHGAGDYATGIGLLAAPKLLRMSDGLAATVLRGTGVAILGVSAMTDYELGLRRRLPMPVHLGVDAATGAMLAAGALGLRRRGRGAANWLPHGVVGVGEIAGALLTARRPGDRASVAGPPVESPPVDDPPGAPPSTRAAPEFDDAVFVAREESSAAAEAARIGGVGAPSLGDPAMDPVYQAGGGEQEGWEEAEADLIENATHGDGQGDPSADAFTPEAESDRSGAVYAETDSLRSTEVDDDGEDTPGSGPRPV